MTSSLVLLCVAAAAIIALSTSAITGLGLLLGRRALERRSPAAQSRVLLGLALLPAFVTLAGITAALAPSFGWIADHCIPTGNPHGHPHICVHHDNAIIPAASLTLLAALFLIRCATVGARILVLGRSASRATRDLMRQARDILGKSTPVLPIDEPRAFVLGVFRPTLFVTRGLLAPDHRSHAASVLAHEQAHLRRADPLRRFIAGLAFAFHLPGVARAIERRLGRAHEMAADDEAARTVGSRARIARALVHLARVKSRPAPPTALAFGGSDLEMRVRALLEPRCRIEEPHAFTLLTIGVALLVLIAGGANIVHHGLEVALGLIGV